MYGLAFIILITFLFAITQNSSWLIFGLFTRVSSAEFSFYLGLVMSKVMLTKVNIHIQFNI